MKRLVLSTIFIFTISLSANAETSLWKVQSGSSVIYIGGTIHILRESDYPLPKEFASAYKDSETIIFETDIEKLQSPDAQLMLLNKVRYTDGLGLEKVLSPEAYNLLEKYCDSVGFPISSMDQFKPVMIVLMLLTLELQSLSVDQAGVDVYFYKQATTDGKDIKGLETVEEHIEFISSMGLGNEDDFVIHSINDIKMTGKIINGLIDAWKNGNEKELSGQFIDPMKRDYPKLYKTLLVERNRNWLPRIEACFKGPPKEFLLVGVGHLIGEDGIIEQLKRRGYQVKKMN